MSSEKITDSVHSISGKSIQEPAVAKSTAISTNSGSNKLESESENAQNASFGALRHLHRVCKVKRSEKN